MRELWQKFFGRPPKFKIGDSVESIRGSDMMVVVDVIKHPDLKEPIVSCKSFDQRTKNTSSHLFNESHLKFFDWERR
jgi:hypothetical protein